MFRDVGSDFIFLRKTPLDTTQHTVDTQLALNKSNISIMCVCHFVRKYRSRGVASAELRVVILCAVDNVAPALNAP